MQKEKSVCTFLPAEIVHREIVDVKTRGDERVEVWHDGCAEVHEHPPVVHVDHLAYKKR